MIRLKKINIKKFYGKSILKLIYEIVIKSKIFDKIILSSDSHELALGKNISFYILIKKSKELSVACAGTSPVIKHVINFFSDNFKIKKYLLH